LQRDYPSQAAESPKAAEEFLNVSRLIISCFDYIDSAVSAVQELIANGVRRSSISVVVHRAAFEQIHSMAPSEVRILLDQPQSIYLSGIGPVLVSGPIAEAYCSAGNEPPTLVRLLEQEMVPDIYANAYTEGVRRRGALVVVKSDGRFSNRILQCLDRFMPVDTIEWAAKWQKSGWTRFDEKAPPLVSEYLNWPSCITRSPYYESFIDEKPHRNWPMDLFRKN